VTALADRGVDTVVCDLDGVLYLGTTPIRGSAAAISRIMAAGMELLFVTNNSTKTRETVAGVIEDRIGIIIDPDQIVTSGVATARFLRDRYERVYVVGTAGLVETLQREGLTTTGEWREADAVVGGLDFGIDYPKLTEATLAVQHGAAFYATNTDATYPMPEGQYPGAGALMAAIERATGVAPVVCGKPHEPIRKIVRDSVGELPVVVGDRPETDIALGIDEGWPTVLVLSGVTSDPGAVPAEFRPDHVLGSLAELPDLLGL